jgi:hypothetical protein
MPAFAGVTTRRGSYVTPAKAGSTELPQSGDTRRCAVAAAFWTAAFAGMTTGRGLLMSA